MCTPSAPRAPDPPEQRQPRYLLSRDQFDELGPEAYQLTHVQQVQDNFRHLAQGTQPAQNAGLGIYPDQGTGGLAP